MPCSELLSRDIRNNATRKDEFAAAVDFSRYTGLHEVGKQLIKGWFARAWDLRDCPAADSFYGFAYTWMAFNRWSSCVTQFRRDRMWIDALSLNHTIHADFAELVSGGQSRLASFANEFRHLWPIFDAEEFDRMKVTWYDGDRLGVIKHYLSSNVRRFEPQCWTRHQNEGQSVPLDWPHTLAALYRVRNNLVHGCKGDSEMNQTIIPSAFRVLLYFLRDAGYLEPD